MTKAVAIMLLVFGPAALALNCADCDDDGRVTILDVLVAAQHSSGMILLSPAARARCDIDADTDVDIIDALRIAEFASRIVWPPACASQGSGWRQVFARSSPRPSVDSAFVWDSRRSLAILHGESTTRSSHTWEWNGAAWSERSLAISPPAGLGGAHSAFDQMRGVLVLFGGFNWNTFSYSDETWEFDGSVWTQRFPVHTPPARDRTTMAYDAARNVTVLFGGVGIRASSLEIFGDTWEWNGSDWNQRVLAGSPQPRMGHALAFDAVRGECVLFGGAAQGLTLFGDTWVYEGTVWRQVPTPSAPAARDDPAACFDSTRGVLVLYGGSSGSQNWEDIWEWNGASWRLASATSEPGPRYGASLTHDPILQETLLFGGRTRCDAPFDGDLWKWDGASWQRLNIDAAPVPDSSRAMCYDSLRSVCVLVATGDETSQCLVVWEWDGAVWSRHIEQGPSRRGWHAVAYDELREETVLFGGGGCSDTTQTWVWNGTVWIQRFPGTSPQFRYGHAMAYDSVAAKIVLFGGDNSSVLKDDTWLWDGAAWTEATGEIRPSPRSLHSMAFDRARNKTVLFGGEGRGIVYGDTWEWDGAGWQLVTSYSGPSPRAAAGMAYDSVRGATILFGGGAGFVLYGDTWQFDGGSWQQVLLSSNPSARVAAACAYDRTRETIVLHGGFGFFDEALLGDTWELRY